LGIPPDASAPDRLARLLLCSRMAFSKKSRGLARSLNRSGVASGKVSAAERRGGRLPEPSGCERCGALFRRRVWRSDVAVSASVLDRVRWTVCPACELQQEQRAFGRVLIRSVTTADEDAVRRRVRNVATRAAATQPQRRLLSMERHGDGLEILTTSQKLSHRIVRELRKTFGGIARYAWSDDGTLFATLDLDDRPGRRPEV
jgi:NMD protein affecting ribosome stability and mRNA decay